MPKVKSKSTAANKLKSKTTATAKTQPVSPEQRYQMIAEAAYFIAEKRGFVGGDIWQDWIDAEAEINRLLHQSSAPSKDDKTTKKAFQQKLEAQLKEWDAILAVLAAKAQGTRAEIQTKIYGEIKILSQMRAEAQVTLKKLHQHTEGAWEDLKSGAEKTLKEMREALDRVATRFKQT